MEPNRTACRAHKCAKRTSIELGRVNNLVRMRETETVSLALTEMPVRAIPSLSIIRCNSIISQQGHLRLEEQMATGCEDINSNNTFKSKQTEREASRNRLC